MDHKAHLKSFSSKLDNASFKPVRLMYGSGSALWSTIHLKPVPVRLLNKQTTAYAIN